jgi:hypothetical protein
MVAATLESINKNHVGNSQGCQSYEDGLRNALHNQTCLEAIQKENT